jgi:hypothetical protein
MGLMERMLHGPTVRLWQKDAETVHAFLATMGPGERTQSRVNTLAALSFMTLDVQGTEHEQAVGNALQAMLRPELCLSREDSGQLSFFLIRQMKHQKQAYESPDLMLKVISAGIPVWITSFRAVQKMELIPLSRKIWAYLDDVNHAEVNEILLGMAEHFAGHPMSGALNSLQQFETPVLFRAR